MATDGIVRKWNPEEGWGVVDVVGVDDGIWVHFSAIEGRPFGYLVEGEAVLVDWEFISHPPQSAQATRVIVHAQANEPDDERPSGVLNSQLTITWDTDPEA